MSYKLSAFVEIAEALGNGSISLTGNDGNNALRGNAASNLLDGGGGVDTLRGGLGSDTYRIDHEADVVIESVGGGNADLVLTTVSFTLGANVEDLQASGSANVVLTGNGEDNGISGNFGDNTLSGLGGSDVLNGGAGADRMLGGTGNDEYRVDNIGDVVTEDGGANGGTDLVRTKVSFTLSAFVENGDLEEVGGAGARTLTGNTGANNLDGSNTLDILNGGTGADILRGLLGNDMLIGGSGADVLTGGSGEDAFVFNTRAELGADTIVDFSPIDDSLQFDNAVLTEVGKNGKLSSDAFHLGTTAADKEDRILYDSKTGILAYDADGIGGTAAIKVATLTNKATIALGDFLVI